MSSVNRDFYLIREVGSEDYSSGYGAYAVPKLYTKGSANSVVGKKNKQAEKYGWKHRWEVVPVTLLIL